MAKILVVEDDKRLNELVCADLRLVGHSCDSLFSGAGVISRLYEAEYDLLLLDVMLPEMDGFEIMEELDAGKIPVIFLTAKSDLKYRVKGLRLGADDYIVKPFELLELQARVDAVLRRTHKASAVFLIDDVKVDLAARTVFKGQVQVDCAPKEFELLEVLIKNRNIALSRDQLLERVWGFDYAGETRTVDVHIQRIRKKLGLENRIKTVYKTGYRLEVKNEG